MGRSAHLVITTETGDIFNIEIDASEPVEHVKALIEVEAGIMLAEQILLFNGVELHNNKRLEEYNVGDNDILLVVRKGQRAPPPQQQPTSHTVSQAPTPQAFLDHVRNNPDLLQQVLANNPPLGEAILSSNLPVIQRFLDHQAQAHRAQEAERQKRMRLMNLDPLSLEYQQALEEEIQMENVNENMEHAMEYTPESFGRVVMLYIDCKANNVPVKAFVDTGAQQTIMSVKCAERCGIMRLIDRRFSGIAKGVGTARIIGRVHMAPIQIGASFFPCSFTILEDQDMEFILGLDMLRRHQCTIDLNNNVLVIGSERTPFLAEKDIPSSFMKEEHEGEIHPPITTTSSSTPSASSPAPVSTSPPPSSTPTSPPSTTTPAPTTTRAPTGGVTPTPTRAPTGGVAPAPISAPTGGAAPPSEEAIGQLMNLGATRQEAIALLRQYRGNVELAASHLFGGGF